MFTEGKYYQQQRAEFKKNMKLVILHTLDSRPMPYLVCLQCLQAEGCA
jgi:hypothetical protein